MAVENRHIRSAWKLFSEYILQKTLIYFFIELLILYLQAIHNSIFAGAWNSVMMLQIANLLCHLFKQLIALFVFIWIRIINVRIYKKLANAVQKTSKISVIFFVISISGKVASPIKTTIIVPNWENVCGSGCYWLYFFAKDLTHQSDEILGRITINSCYFVAFFHWKLFHHTLNNWKWVIVELLKVVTKVSHYMITL